MSSAYILSSSMRRIIHQTLRLEIVPEYAGTSLSLSLSLPGGGGDGGSGERERGSSLTGAKVYGCADLVLLIPESPSLSLSLSSPGEREVSSYERYILPINFTSDAKVENVYISASKMENPPNFEEREREREKAGEMYKDATLLQSRIRPEAIPVGQVSDRDASVARFCVRYTHTKEATKDGEMEISIPREVMQSMPVVVTKAGTETGTTSEEKCRRMIVRIEYSLSLGKSYSGGLMLDGDLIYTPMSLHSARHYMPCFDTLTDLCVWSLALTTPKEWMAVTSGRLREQVLTGTNNAFKTSYFDLRTSVSPRSLSILSGPMSLFVHEEPKYWSSFAPLSEAPADLSTTNPLDSLLRNSCTDPAAQIDEWMWDTVGTDLRGIISGAERREGESDDSTDRSIYQQVFIPSPALRLHATGFGVAIFPTSSLHPPQIIEQAYQTRERMARAACEQLFSHWVVPATWSDWWIVEGLARFATLQYIRSSLGECEYRFRLRSLSLSLSSLSVGSVQPLYCRDYIHPAELYTKLFKAKSVLVIALIHSYLPNILKRIVEETKSSDNRIWSTQRFFEFLEAELEPAMKKDAGNFANNIRKYWVEGLGFPTFTCGYRFNDSQGTLEVVLRQDPRHKVFREPQVWEEKGMLYEGPYTLRVVESEGPVDHNVYIRGRFNYFQFPCRSKPKKRQRVIKRTKKDAGEKKDSGDTSKSTADGKDGDKEKETEEITVRYMESPVLYIVPNPSSTIPSNCTPQQNEVMLLKCIELEYRNLLTSQLNAQNLSDISGNSVGNVEEVSDTTLRAIQAAGERERERERGSLPPGVSPAAAMAASVSAAINSQPSASAASSAVPGNNAPAGSSGGGATNTSKMRVSVCESVQHSSAGTSMEALLNAVELLQQFKHQSGGATVSSASLSDPTQVTTVQVQLQHLTQPNATRKSPYLSLIIHSLAVLLRSPKCFYRIRIAAANALGKLAGPETAWRALDALEKTYREKYFKSEAEMEENPDEPRLLPNDFSNFADYFVQKAMVSSLCDIKTKDGTRTPADVFSFILELLKENNNIGNKYSDVYWLAHLLKCCGKLVSQNRSDIESLASNLERFRQLDQNKCTSLLTNVPQGNTRDLNHLLVYQNLLSRSCVEALSLLQANGHMPISTALFEKTAENPQNFCRLRLSCIEAILRVQTMKSAKSLLWILDRFDGDKSPWMRRKILQLLVDKVPSMFPPSDLQKHIRYLHLSAGPGEGERERERERENRLLARRLYALLYSHSAAVDGRIRASVLELCSMIYGTGVPEIIAPKAPSTATAHATGALNSSTVIKTPHRESQIIASKSKVTSSKKKSVHKKPPQYSDDSLSLSDGAGREREREREIDVSSGSELDLEDLEWKKEIKSKKVVKKRGGKAKAEGRTARAKTKKSYTEYAEEDDDVYAFTESAENSNDLPMIKLKLGSETTEISTGNSNSGNNNKKSAKLPSLKMVISTKENKTKEAKTPKTSLSPPIYKSPNIEKESLPFRYITLKLPGEIICTVEMYIHLSREIVDGVRRALLMQTGNGTFSAPARRWSNVMYFPFYFHDRDFTAIERNEEKSLLTDTLEYGELAYWVTDRTKKYGQVVVGYGPTIAAAAACAENPDADPNQCKLLTPCWKFGRIMNYSSVCAQLTKVAQEIPGDEEGEIPTEKWKSIKTDLTIGMYPPDTAVLQIGGGKSCGSVSLPFELYSGQSPLVDAFSLSLPTNPSYYNDECGDMLYFSVEISDMQEVLKGVNPAKMPKLTQPTDLVPYGTLVYWEGGQSLCLISGPTVFQSGSEPPGYGRLAGECWPLGRLVVNDDMTTIASAIKSYIANRNNEDLPWQAFCIPMYRQVSVEIKGDVELKMKGVLYNSTTANEVWNKLPIEGPLNLHGSLLYIESPLRKSSLLKTEKQVRDTLATGEIAYWNEGSSVVMGWGPTPPSLTTECRLSAFCPVLGRLESLPRLWSHCMYVPEARKTEMESTLAKLGRISNGSTFRMEKIDSPSFWKSIHEPEEQSKVSASTTNNRKRKAATDLSESSSTTAEKRPRKSAAIIKPETKSGAASGGAKNIAAASGGGEAKKGAKLTVKIGGKAAGGETPATPVTDRGSTNADFDIDSAEKFIVRFGEGDLRLRVAMRKDSGIVKDLVKSVPFDTPLNNLKGMVLLWTSIALPFGKTDEGPAAQRRKWTRSVLKYGDISFWADSQGKGTGLVIGTGKSDFGKSAGECRLIEPCVVIGKVIEIHSAQNDNYNYNYKSNYNSDSDVTIGEKLREALTAFESGVAVYVEREEEREREEVRDSEVEAPPQPVETAPENEGEIEKAEEREIKEDPMEVEGGGEMDNQEEKEGENGGEGGEIDNTATEVKEENPEE